MAYKTPHEVHFALAANTPVDMMDDTVVVAHIPTGATTNGSFMTNRDKCSIQTLIYPYKGYDPVNGMREYYEMVESAYDSRPPE